MDRKGEPHAAGRRAEEVSRLMAAYVVNGEHLPSPVLLEHLCLAARTRLEVGGVSVAVTTSERSHTIASSDERSARIDEVQFTLGEGPSRDAIAWRRPVLTSDLDAPESNRWPVYRGVARDAGVRGVLTFPLHIGASVLGVMTIYLERPEPMAEEAMAMALAFAGRATEILLDGTVEASLETVLELEADIYIAQGMTTIDAGLSLTEAMRTMLHPSTASSGRPWSAASGHAASSAASISVNSAAQGSMGM
jgi:hypothetical protein